MKRKKMTIVKSVPLWDIKCICHELDNSDWAPHNQHLFEPQVTEDDEEEEEPPVEESDCDTDLEDMPDSCTRVPTFRRQCRQPPKVLMLQSITKCPAEWPAGARAKVPPKPDHLRNGHNQPEPEEECEYLEPIQRHQYAEPTYTDDTVMHTDQPDEDSAYELVGSMENLEQK